MGREYFLILISNYKTKSNSERLSYLVINDQLSTNCLYVTASSNLEWDPFANDLKERGNKSSLGTISLKCPRGCCLGWPVFEPSDPPLTLLFGWLSSFACCWVITVGRLIVKYCSSPNPTTQVRFEVEFASFRRKGNRLFLNDVTDEYRSISQPEFHFISRMWKPRSIDSYRNWS